MKKDRKIQKTYTDYGCGFAIKLINVPLIKIRGQWTPDVDYNLLQMGILGALACKPSRLTGSEIKFIRHFFEMNLTDFAKRFSVKHPAVIKWEKTKDKPTKMNWSTEKDIRLFIISKLKIKPIPLKDLYLELEEEKPIKKSPVEVDISALAA